MWENHSADYWKAQLKRKEAMQKKIAFAVGGALAAVLLLYVLFHRSGSPRIRDVPRPAVTKDHMHKCIELNT